MGRVALECHPEALGEEAELPQQAAGGNFLHRSSPEIGVNLLLFLLWFPFQLLKIATLGWWDGLKG